METKTTIEMTYGQNPKCRKQWVFGREVPNRNVSNDYGIGGLTAIPVGRKLSVGENPLNRNELPSARNGGGEEIVCSHVKA